MDNFTFVEKLKNVQRNYHTIYMWGVFGSLVTDSLIATKASQYPTWYTATRQALLKSKVGRFYFAFDCVNLIKAILWGWDGSTDKAYGGAEYLLNRVPDIGADTMITKCAGVSTNFSNIEVGEAVWMKGHIGVYIGDGKVIECTPSWDNGVQVSACLNIGPSVGLNGRKWVSHGKLPYITYIKQEVVDMASKYFKDVLQDWQAIHVDSLKEKGIVAGKTVDTFDPEAPITRAEAAVVIDKAITYVIKEMSK